LFCATAAVRAAFNSDHDGKALQPLKCSLSGTCASADAATRTSHIIVTSMGTKTFFLFIIFLSFHRFCSHLNLFCVSGMTQMSSLTIMQNRGLIRELLVEAKPKLAEESYRLPEIFYRQVDKYFPGHVSLSPECVPPSRCRGGAARFGAGR